MPAVKALTIAELKRERKLSPREKKQVELFAKIDQIGEENAEVSNGQIFEALCETETVRAKVENMLVLLREESKKLAVAQHSWSEYLRMSHQIDRANDQIQALWQARPTRFHDSSTGVGAALHAQSVDRKQDIAAISKYLKELDFCLKMMMKMEEEMTAEMKIKEMSLSTDSAALKVRYSRDEGGHDGVVGKEVLSPRKQEQWTGHNDSLLAHAATRYERAVEARQSGPELWESLAENDAAVYEEVKEAMSQKLEMWQQLIWELNNTATEARGDIKELKHLIGKAKPKLQEVRASTMRPDSKLTTRRKRPGMECKADLAEASLLQEIKQAQKSMQSIQEHVQEMQTEKAEVEVTMTEAEEKLKDAEKALELDTKIHKKILSYGCYIDQMCDMDLSMV